MTGYDLEKELAKSQARKSTGRKSSLQRRISNKYPLFAAEIIAQEIDKNGAYYEAIPNERDRQIIAFRVAEKENPQALIQNYLTEDYEHSGIEFAYRSMEYRDIVRHSVSPIQFLSIASIEFFSYRGSQPHYRADYWWGVLRQLNLIREPTAAPPPAKPIETNQADLFLDTQ